MQEIIALGVHFEKTKNVSYQCNHDAIKMYYWCVSCSHCMVHSKLGRNVSIRPIMGPLIFPWNLLYLCPHCVPRLSMLSTLIMFPPCHHCVPRKHIVRILTMSFRWSWGPHCTLNNMVPSPYVINTSRLCSAFNSYASSRHIGMCYKMFLRCDSQTH